MHALVGVGQAAGKCVELLAEAAKPYPIGWQGEGSKEYVAFSSPNDLSRYSRPVRSDLFISDAASFAYAWTELVEAIEAARGKGRLAPSMSSNIDRSFYTAIIGFAAAHEIAGSTDRGGPGTFYEMAVGPAVSLLADLPETGSISLPVPDVPDAVETLPTDLSFIPPDERATVLVLPTKISTRERISQAYVHQAILEKAYEKRTYRSALCIGSETNMFLPRGADRKVTNVFARDTLVPNTIVLYQRYIAQLAGLYYLDPPARYVDSEIKGFPSVKHFAGLLTGDLPRLLS